MGIVTGGIIAGAGALAGGVAGAIGSTTAAGEEVSAEQQALNITQQNQAPFIQAGQQSISQIMKGLSNGTFGPGSIPAFQAPTLAQAQQYPGYQFSQQAGNQAILASAAAQGGNISGGTTKSLEAYDVGLANNTYSTLFNQALSGYGAQLQGQQQGFSQLLAPAQIGEAATQNQNATVSQLMQAIGGAQAAGTVGATNSITGGITGVANAASGTLSTQAILAALGIGPGGLGASQGGANPTFETNTPAPAPDIPGLPVQYPAATPVGFPG